MQTDGLDPPERLWPTLALLGYLAAGLRRELWLSLGDGLWRIRLRRHAGVAYQRATVADRDAHRIAHWVRRLYEEVPDAV